MNEHKKEEENSANLLVSYFKDVFLLRTGLSNLPLLTSPSQIHWAVYRCKWMTVLFLCQ
jgi:hypothetical protein